MPFLLWQVVAELPQLLDLLGELGSLIEHFVEEVLPSFSADDEVPRPPESNLAFLRAAA